MTTQTPPTLNAPHAITALNAAEVLITFGHTRMQVSDDGDGTAPAVAMQEWHFTVSMSPTAADSLLRALGTTLMRYREKYGPITEDKGMAARLIEADRVSSGAPPQPQ